MYSSYIKNFIKNLNISQEVVIGLSGGVDSMLLVDIMKQMGFEIQAVHINHNTRLECILEQKMVEKYCKKMNIQLDVYSYSHKVGNFEEQARLFRYKVFNSYKRCVLTAHHIDDSFEWYLMNQFKTSSEVLGIPVKSKNVIRPLMCLTKSQIYELAKKHNIPFMEDSSNSDINFERNYVRNKVIPSIKKRYPSYLKHYVNRMNIRAKELGMHYSQQKTIKPKKMTDIKLKRSASYREVERAIKDISVSSRGNLSSNILKLISAIESGKSNFVMNFSGGVDIRVGKAELTVYKRN